MEKLKARPWKKEEIMVLPYISLWFGTAKSQTHHSWDNILVVVPYPVLILQITTRIESKFLCQLSQKKEKFLLQWNCDGSVFCVSKLW